MRVLFLVSRCRSVQYINVSVCWYRVSARLRRFFDVSIKDHAYLLLFLPDFESLGKMYIIKSQDLRDDETQKT